MRAGGKFYQPGKRKSKKLKMHNAEINRHIGIGYIFFLIKRTRQFKKMNKKEKEIFHEKK